ncbi:MAG: type II secretion system F family protein [Candidatus Micrarchaeota archaeon]|nr:type II secretion system F family protein [Candidatus Micrarchaeota archaeon]MCX8154583.1 type II secretion system F family protein [Candidatus Micrarchaeota archaeon]
MNLQQKLKVAGYEISEDSYRKRAIILSIIYSFLSTALIGILILISNAVNDMNLMMFLILLVFLGTLLMWYLINIKEVDVKIEMYRKGIDYELGFLLKHMVVVLRSGIPPYNIFLLTSKGYGKASEVMERIAKKISSGISPSKALREEAEMVPSNYMKFVLLQIASGIDTGGDLAKILEELEKQITNEKVNEYRRFGYRLSPMMLIYMLLAIILPTLSVPIILIILSFTGRGADLNIIHLVLLLMVVGMVQYMFYRYIMFAKPRYSLFE